MSTGKGTKRAAGSNAGTPAAARAQTFVIEYAKSSQSSCFECQLKIPRNEIRIKITAPDPQDGIQFGGQVSFFHVECFATPRNKLGWMEAADLLPGFTDLYAHDQATVMIQLP